MTETIANPPADSSAPRRFLPLLLLLFVGSGCAALIYEIVWLQLLQLVIGSSAISLGVLLGTFMGGMCLGSLALPRFITPRRHPLRVYAALEIGIGVLGVALLYLMPLVTRLYVANAAQGLIGLLLRGLVCAACLLPPTLLMGATLPAISRWVESTPRGVSWLGFFYAGNIAGAVTGCLLAGFYLLRVHDMAVATYVAAAINGIVALLALCMATNEPHEVIVSPPPDHDRSEASVPQFKNPATMPWKGDYGICVTIALSGLCALGAEVIWTRLLSLLLGATVYTFSIILAVFLAGLGIGSSVGSFLARCAVRPRLALGGCQLLLTAAIAWAAWMITRSLPYWPVDPSLVWSPWFNFQLDLARCLWAVLPAACLWGASFPLALAAAASPGEDAGRLVSRIYAANTVGAIIGALGASLLLISWIGTQQAQRLLIALSALAALLAFAPFLLAPFRPENSYSQSASQNDESSHSHSALVHGFKIVGVVLLFSSVAYLIAWSVPKIPWGLVAQGRYLATKGEEGKLLYLGEGLNASVAVTETHDGVRNFHVSGKVEASTDPRDMRLQRMLGHIPALLHRQPRSVLIVGCGAGVTAGSFVVHPGIERIVICEIEPLIPQAVSRYFAKENYSVVRNPRVQVVYDDARHFILTTRDKFDIITSDPIHPWVKGAATLYTKEYFELCKQHLNPGGLVTQWVPLYESNLGVVKSELATFFDVFPQGTVWSNDDEGKGYDVVLLGQTDSGQIDVDELQKRLERPDHIFVAQSLRDVQFKSALDLLATYAGRGPDLAPWLKRAEINRDRNLRLQYLAGMSPNIYREHSIFDEMVAYRKFPEDLFVASDDGKLALRAAIERSKAGK